MTTFLRRRDDDSEPFECAAPITCQFPKCDCGEPAMLDAEMLAGRIERCLQNAGPLAHHNVTLNNDECRAIASALRQSKSREWQPIETAKLEEGSFLVWVPENLCTFHVVPLRDVNGKPTGKLAIFGGEHRDFLDRATHWMPRPTPPFSSADKPSET